MRKTSFCPGHITGFFQIREHKDALRSGSRGAGLCVGLGTHCTVQAEEGEGKKTIRFAGVEVDAPVTMDAVSYILGQRKLDVVVDLIHDLPIGQGFGMSAAGALSAAHALSEIIGLPFSEAIRAAHKSEFRHRTGLGDVAALSRGGITFRRKEGVPPFGQVDRINAEPELVLCVVGDPISTAEVLSDPRKRERLNKIGNECVEKMSAAPTLNNLMRLSRDFMKRSELAPPRVEEAVQAAEKHGQASMVMLGSSVFAVGDVERLEEALRPFGTVYRTKVDWRGPRIIESPR
jgi:pantoate kinase